MNKESIILVRCINGIGIDVKGNGFNTLGVPLKKRYYNNTAYVPTTLREVRTFVAAQKFGF